MAVRIHTDYAGRFEASATVLVGEGPEDAEEMRISSSRPHRGGLLVVFENFEDRDRAERLRGLLVFSPGPLQATAPIDGFLEGDLVGLEVVDPAGRLLGSVAAVHLREAQDLWEVRTEEGEAVLLPAVEEFVKEVDPESRRIVADPPEGLFPATSGGRDEAGHP